MDKVKQAIAWGVLAVVVLLFAFIAITGKVAILTAVVLVPDDVAVK